LILPEKLLFVELEVEKGKLEDVVVRLGRWGFFHPQDSGKGFLSFEYEQLFSKVRDIVEFLQISPAPFTASVNLESLKARVDSLYRQVLAVKEKMAQLEREKELLALAKRLDNSFEQNVSKLLKTLKVIPFKAGVVKKGVYDKLLLALKSEKLLAYFSTLFHGDMGVVVFFPPDKEFMFDKLQSAFSIRVVPTCYFDPEFRKKLIEEEKRLALDVKRLKENNEKEIAELYSFLRFKRKVSEIVSGAKERNGRRILKGWIPENKKKEFLKLFSDCQVRFYPPGKNPPSLIKTPSFLKPIEEIVFSYSYPSYHDINPVLPFVAVFVLLFGVMFGDVGHGLMLSALAILLEKKGKKAIGRLMLLSGISSMIFGFLYGSAFGREVFHPLLFSPMKSVESLLVFSIGIGVAVITAGFIIKFFSSVHRESFEQIFFGEEGVLSFAAYWLSLGILIKALVLKMSVKVELLILFILLLTSFFYAFKKTRQAATSFIDAVRILLENLINTLSFMRLGAFALAHGALFFAVFTVAESVRSLKGGTLIYWLVVILGNLFVVALEGLIVTIQALRLNYYEFFKKFYRGGGRPFKPFRLEIE